MTAATVLLVILTVWSLLMLAGYDQITAAARARVRALLFERRHRAVYSDEREGRCVCGWDVTRYGSRVAASDMVTPQELPDGIDLGGVVADRLAAHVDIARRADPGPWVQMLQCPYCLGFWLAVPVALSAVRWADVWWWQTATLALGARAAAGALAAYLTPFDSDDD